MRSGWAADSKQGANLRFASEVRIRSVLKRFGTDEAAVDEASVVGYLRDPTQSVGTEDALAEWRDGLVEFGLSRLADDDPDPND